MISQKNKRDTLYGQSTRNMDGILSGGDQNPNSFANVGTDSMQENQQRSILQMPQVESVQTLRHSAKQSGDLQRLEEFKQVIQNEAYQNSVQTTDIIDIITREQSEPHIEKIQSSPKVHWVQVKQTSANIVDLNQNLAPQISQVRPHNLQNSPYSSPVRSPMDIQQTVSPKAFLNPTQRERLNKFREQTSLNFNKNDSQKQFIGLQPHNVVQLEQLDQLLYENRFNVLQQTASGGNKFPQGNVQKGDKIVRRSPDQSDIGIQGQSKTLEPSIQKFIRVSPGKHECRKPKFDYKKAQSSVISQNDSNSQSPRIKTAHLEHERTNSSQEPNFEIVHSSKLENNSKIYSGRVNSNDFEKAYLQQISSRQSSRHSNKYSSNIHQRKRESVNHLKVMPKKYPNMNADLKSQLELKKQQMQQFRQQPQANQKLHFDETSRNTQYMKNNSLAQSSAIDQHTAMKQVMKPINISIGSKDGSSTSVHKYMPSNELKYSGPNGEEVKNLVQKFAVNSKKTIKSPENQRSNSNLLDDLFVNKTASNSKMENYKKISKEQLFKEESDFHQKEGLETAKDTVMKVRSSKDALNVNPQSFNLPEKMAKETFREEEVEKLSANSPVSDSFQSNRGNMILNPQIVQVNGNRRGVLSKSNLHNKSGELKKMVKIDQSPFRHKNLQEASGSYSNSPSTREDKRMLTLSPSKRKNIQLDGKIDASKFQSNDITEMSAEVFIHQPKGILPIRNIKRDDSKESIGIRSRKLLGLQPLKISNNKYKENITFPKIPNSSKKKIEGPAMNIQSFATKESIKNKEASKNREIRDSNRNSVNSSQQQSLRVSMSPSMRMQKAKRQLQKQKQMKLRNEVKFNLSQSVNWQKSPSIMQQQSKNKSIRASIDQNMGDITENHYEDRQSELENGFKSFQVASPSPMLFMGQSRYGQLDSILTPHDSTIQSPEFHQIKTQKYSFHMAEQMANAQKTLKKKDENKYKYRTKQNASTLFLQPQATNTINQQTRQIHLFQQYSVIKDQKPSPVKHESQRQVVQQADIVSKQYELNPHVTQTSSQSPRVNTGKDNAGTDTVYGNSTKVRKESLVTQFNEANLNVMKKKQISNTIGVKSKNSKSPIDRKSKLKIKTDDSILSPFTALMKDDFTILTPKVNEPETATNRPEFKLINQRTSINHEDQQLMQTTGAVTKNQLPKIVQISTKSSPNGDLVDTVNVNNGISSALNKLNMNEVKQMDMGTSSQFFNTQKKLSPKVVSKFRKQKKKVAQSQLQSVQNMPMMPVNNSTVEFSEINPMGQAIHIQSKEILPKSSLKKMNDLDVQSSKMPQIDLKNKKMMPQAQTHTQSFFRVLPSLKSREISPRYSNQLFKNKLGQGVSVKKRLMNNSVDFTKQSKKRGTLRLTTDFSDINEQLNQSFLNPLDAILQNQSDTLWAPLESSTNNIVMEQQSILESNDSSEGVVTIDKNDHVNLNKSGIKFHQSGNSVQQINAISKSKDFQSRSKLESSINRSNSNSISKSKLRNQTSETLLARQKTDFENQKIKDEILVKYMSPIDVEQLCESKPNLLIPNTKESGNLQTKYKKRFQQPLNEIVPQSLYSQTLDQSALITPKYLNRNKNSPKNKTLDSQDGFTNRTLAEYMVAQNAGSSSKKFKQNPLVHYQNAQYIQSRQIDIYNKPDFTYTTVTNNIKQNMLKLKPDRRTLEAVIDNTFSSTMNIQNEQVNVIEINQFPSKPEVTGYINEESASMRTIEQSTRNDVNKDNAVSEKCCSPYNIRESPEKDGDNLLSSDQKREIVQARMSVVNPSNVMMPDIVENEEYLENLSQKNNQIMSEQDQDQPSMKSPKSNHFNQTQITQALILTPNMGGSFMQSKMINAPMSPDSSVFGQSPKHPKYNSREIPKLNINQNRKMNKTNVTFRQDVAVGTSSQAISRQNQAISIKNDNQLIAKKIDLKF